MDSTNKTRLLLFEELSAVLTGFSLADIQGTGMSRTYLMFLDDRKSDAPIDELLDAFDGLVANPDHLTSKEIGLVGAILEDDALSPMSQQLIFMWYTGQWNYGKDDTFVISSQAYVESFSYIAAGGHPPAAVS